MTREPERKKTPLEEVDDRWAIIHHAATDLIAAARIIEASAAAIDGADLGNEFTEARESLRSLLGDFRQVRHAIIFKLRESDQQD